MRLVVFVACFLGLASGRPDCARPTNSDIEDVLMGIIGSSTPVINVIDFTPRCLAVSAQRGRFRYFSALVEYTCTGHPLCPTGTRREQIESECDGRVWSNKVLGSTLNTRDTNVTDPPVSVPTRRDCAFCASPTLSDSVIGQQSDDVYHCVACATNCSGSPGQNACTGLNPEDCCNVYDNDTGQYKCDTDCPDDGIYVIDSETFMCLITCEDLGSDVENGSVVYSTLIEQAKGRYRQNTTATVTCDAGFRGGGDITCERSGEWTAPSLPICKEIRVVDCGDPPALDNGRLTETPPTSTTVGSTVTYVCNDGYIFKKGSEMSRTCLKRGNWSNVNIECRPKRKKGNNNNNQASDSGGSTSYPSLTVLVGPLLCGLMALK